MCLGTLKCRSSAPKLILAYYYNRIPIGEFLLESLSEIQSPGNHHIVMFSALPGSCIRTSLMISSVTPVPYYFVPKGLVLETWCIPGFSRCSGNSQFAIMWLGSG